ncbi:MAG TPA: hypothetical protein VK838_01430 [Candidatus Limnocylindrales bacterium]|nr:hypothetical protein [Candidatus Limnocylindrales bacterium]
MSRAELPVSLLDLVLGGGPAGRVDEVTADRLERVLGRVEPDPLFKRRLRGSIVNYHVASREGHLRRARGPRRQMGAIGRSVLYASVVLALGVSAVGVAAQDSLPGEALYGVKLRLEEVRLQIAPQSVRAQLAAISLGARIDELERLASAGDWSRVAAAAGRLAAAEALVAADPDAPLIPIGASATHAVEVLQAVLATAPDSARPDLENALAASSGSATGVDKRHAGNGSQGSPRASTPAVELTHPPQARDGEGPRADTATTGQRRAAGSN